MTPRSCGARSWAARAIRSRAPSARPSATRKMEAKGSSGGQRRRSEGRRSKRPSRKWLTEIADKTRKMVRDPSPKGGRESVARPTDRAIGRDPASMAGAVRGPPNLNSLAQPTSGRRGRPQGRAKLTGKLAAMTILRHPLAAGAGPTSHAAVMAVAVPSAMDRRDRPAIDALKARQG